MVEIQGKGHCAPYLFILWITMSRFGFQEVTKEANVKLWQELAKLLSNESHLHLDCIQLYYYAIIVLMNLGISKWLKKVLSIT